jgi:hypothetical protein
VQLKSPVGGAADHELNLGEFQDVDTLTLSKASLVINALAAKRKMDRKNINETEYVFWPLNPLPPMDFLFLKSTGNPSPTGHTLSRSNSVAASKAEGV